jgi:hypothetical protein
VKSDANPTHYTPDGLAFDDGTELKAEVIVFATGFVGNMCEIVSTIVGSEIESQLGDFWGLDSEGKSAALSSTPDVSSSLPVYNENHIVPSVATSSDK